MWMLVLKASRKVLKQSTRKQEKILSDGIQKAQEVVDDVDISAEDIKKG